MALWFITEPMDRWPDYELIIALSTGRTLRKAAALLGLSHATVSRRLSRLDAQFSQPLFEKSSDGYVRTSLGDALFDAAQKMDECSRITVDKCRQQQGDAKSEVRFSCTDSHARYLLDDALERFQAENPNVRLNLVVSSTLADLDRSEADVVLRCAEAPPEHLVGRALFPLAYGFYVHRDCSDADIAGLSWIAHATDWDARSDNRLSKRLRALPVSTISTSVMHRARCVSREAGLAYLPCFVGAADPSLRHLSETEIDRNRRLWLLTYPRVKDIPRISAFMQFLYPALASKSDVCAGG